MQAAKLMELIQQPESEILEFKLKLLDPRGTARLISAFANTNGGTIIVGVNDNKEIVGVDDLVRTRIALEKALVRITPPIAIHSETVTFDGKSLLVVTVDRGQAPPYLSDGLAFQRQESRIVPITYDVLYNNIIKPDTSIEEIRVNVKGLVGQMEILNRERIMAKSLRNRIPDMVLGGIIGTLISIALAILFGLP